MLAELFNFPTFEKFAEKSWNTKTCVHDEFPDNRSPLRDRPDGGHLVAAGASVRVRVCWSLLAKKKTSLTANPLPPAS